MDPTAYDPSQPYVPYPPQQATPYVQMPQVPYIPDVPYGTMPQQPMPYPYGQQPYPQQPYQVLQSPYGQGTYMSQPYAQTPPPTWQPLPTSLPTQVPQQYPYVPTPQTSVQKRQEKPVDFSPTANATAVRVAAKDAQSCQAIGERFMARVMGLGGVQTSIPELSIPYAIYVPSHRAAFTYQLLPDNQVLLFGVSLTSVLVRPKGISSSTRTGILYPAVAFATEGTDATIHADSVTRDNIAKAQAMPASAPEETPAKESYGLYEDTRKRAAKLCLGLSLVPFSVLLLQIDSLLMLILCLLCLPASIACGISASKAKVTGTHVPATLGLVLSAIQAFVVIFACAAAAWVLSR